MVSLGGEVPDEVIETIATRRLSLRALATSDIDDLFALFADWAVIEHLSAPPWPYERSHMEDFVNSLMRATEPSREIFRVVICDGKPIGGISLRERPISHVQSGIGPNIGYWLGVPYWGQGYMTEAVVALNQHIFANSDVDAIYSGAFAENAASLRVQSKSGFTRDGETKLYSNPKNTFRTHVNTVLNRHTLPLAPLSGKSP